MSISDDDDDDDFRQSEDDALESGRSYFNPDLDETRLPGDYDSPAASASDIPGPAIPKSDPRLDSGLDSDEVYSEGYGEATDATEEEVPPVDRAEPLEP